MTMESLSLLPRLRKLPASENITTLDHDETVTRIRGMDRDHFAFEVSQATEEVLEALFHARNVPDNLVNNLNEAYDRSFSSFAEQGRSVHEHFQEMMERGPNSVTGFVSNLKGKVAELEIESALEERHSGYDFELAESATQPGHDLIGTSPDGPDILVQVKVGGAAYADKAVDAMQDSPNVAFWVSREIYDRIAETHPELLGRLTDIAPVVELTESVSDGLGTLAANRGIDVPDSIGEALPFVGEVVLGIKLIWGMVKTERELVDVELPDRSKVHGIRALALASRFGINQLCMWAGIKSGAMLGTALAPGLGTAAGGLVGGVIGLPSGMMLHRRLQPRIEEVAIKLVGGDADDVFYLMNKVEIDQLGQSFAATQVA